MGALVKEDFCKAADHMVNEDWLEIADFAKAIWRLDGMSFYYNESKLFSEVNARDIDNCWALCCSKLINSLLVFY